MEHSRFPLLMSLCNMWSCMEQQISLAANNMYEIKALPWIMQCELSEPRMWIPTVWRTSKRAWKNAETKSKQAVVTTDSGGLASPNNTIAVTFQRHEYMRLSCHCHTGVGRGKSSQQQTLWPKKQNLRHCQGWRSCCSCVRTYMGITIRSHSVKKDTSYHQQGTHKWAPTA